jgi:aspartate/methionine/tyrosine aminotransferase
MQLNQEAEALNETIEKNSEVVYSLLSDKGKAIFFPKKGILSQSADAKGKKINATIGTALEDDGTPMRLKCIQQNILNISAENAFQYAPSYGRQDIREKWKAMIYEKNPGLGGKEISLPVVTNALTHGLNMAAYLFVDKNDRVITSNLFWENYGLIFENAYGGKLAFFNLFKNNRFDTESLKKKLQKGGIGKKILILNFPNNPAGYTPTVEEAKEIVNIIRESAEQGNKIVVLVDDAYFGLVYEEGIEKESIFSYLADIHPNILAVKIDGPTKEDYVWGFRVGFLTYAIKGGNKELYSALESKTAGAVRGDISNSPNLSQSLLMKAYTSESYSDEKKEKYEILKARYEIVKKTLEDKKYSKYFKALPCNSGYFMCIELKGGIDAEILRQKLLTDFSTGVIVSGTVIRIAFSAVQKEKLVELFENIYNACKQLKGE